jgi:hypothetical protein
MQTVEAKVKTNQQSKSKKMVAKRLAEVWWQCGNSNSNAGTATAKTMAAAAVVAVAAKALQR